MFKSLWAAVGCGLLLMPSLIPSCSEGPETIERPQKIVSMRQVVYDHETYRQLADLWKKYYDRFPSEDAYANWMYASRYAGASDYQSLLKKGVEKYSANPTLLYLQALLRHGKRDNVEGQALLERATRLDPSYMDPWFALVGHYLEKGDREKTDMALRRLLESGIIQNEVMDFSYNMMACLEKNALLVTNGDNDTYPGWILTRIVGYRPDVRIVNRSLLNTDWYALTLIREGVPNFITQAEVDSLRKAVDERLAAGKGAVPPGGPYSDALLARLLEACRRDARPVYIAATVERSGLVEQIVTSGRDLGLVTLVTPPAEPYRKQVRHVVEVWLKEFRTSGMDDWEVRYAKPSHAGRMLMQNYAQGLNVLMDRILRDAPEHRLGLFRWYQEHALDLVPEKNRDEVNRMWCRSKDIREINDWCRRMNYTN